MAVKCTQMYDKSKKAIIAEAILGQMPKNDPFYQFCQNLTNDQIVFRWWMSGRLEGLRLSDEGEQAFTLAQIEYYTCPYTNSQQSWYSFIIACNKKIACPYYLGSRRLENKKNEPYIKLYDSKVAMMINLYGNLEDYLNSIKVR